MMGKLVTWGGRLEIPFSPWDTLTGHGRVWSKDLILILHLLFLVLVILHLTWGRERVISRLWGFSTNKILGLHFWAGVPILEKIILFTALLMQEPGYFISKTSVTVQFRHQIQELLGKVPFCPPRPYYKALTGSGLGSFQTGNSRLLHTDPLQSQ